MSWANPYHSLNGISRYCAVCRLSWRPGRLTSAGIKLAPEILEPEPIDIQDILHRDDRKKARREGPAGADGVWSGEATRNAGFNVSGGPSAGGGTGHAQFDVRPRLDQNATFVEKLGCS